jgi:hypothetical protein
MSENAESKLSAQMPAMRLQPDSRQQLINSKVSAFMEHKGSLE